MLLESVADCIVSSAWHFISNGISIPRADLEGLYPVVLAGQGPRERALADIPFIVRCLNDWSIEDRYAALLNLFQIDDRYSHAWNLASAAAVTNRDDLIQLVDAAWRRSVSIRLFGREFA